MYWSQLFPGPSVITGFQPFMPKHIAKVISVPKNSLIQIRHYKIIHKIFLLLYWLHFPVRTYLCSSSSRKTLLDEKGVCSCLAATSLLPNSHVLSLMWLLKHLLSLLAFLGAGDPSWVLPQDLLCPLMWQDYSSEILSVTDRVSTPSAATGVTPVYYQAVLGCIRCEDGCKHSARYVLRWAPRIRVIIVSRTDRYV